MSLARCQLSVTDDNGTRVDGASITVQLEAIGLPLVSVYSDRDGASALGNPFTAADGGDAGFYVADGFYRITATLGAFTRVWQDVTVVSPRAAESAGVVGAPAHTLSLVSGFALSDSDVTGATTLYSVPQPGGFVPIFNGTSLVPGVVGQLSLGLNSNSGHTGYHQSGKIFDAFMIDVAGTAVFGTATVPWASDVSRGTGSGTLELEALDGVLVNKHAITLRFGTASGDTVAVAARRATLIGSVRMTANGQTEDSRSARVVASAYFPMPRALRAIDTTDTWTYSTATFRQFNGSTANKAVYLHCLSGRMVSASVLGNVNNSTATLRVCAVGLGIDSTTVDSSTLKGRVTVGATPLEARVQYVGNPGIGYHELIPLELGGGTDTQTWRGDSGTTTIQTGLVAQTMV